MTKTYYHVTPSENKNSILSHGLLPKIGERSEDIETMPAIFLFPDEQSMQTALGSWFGELFNEDDKLTAFSVKLPDKYIQNSTINTVEYETMCLDPIPTEWLTYHSDE